MWKTRFAVKVDHCFFRNMFVIAVFVKLWMGHTDVADQNYNSFMCD